MDLEMCRICGGFQHLKKILEEDSELMNKMLLCTNIDMSSGDLLPKIICAQCDKNLNLCYNLRKQGEATQRRLMLEIQRKQKACNHCEPETVTSYVPERLGEETDYEKIDLSQDSEDSIESKIYGNCTTSYKAYKTQLEKNKMYGVKEIEMSEDNFKTVTLQHEVLDKNGRNFEQFNVTEAFDIGHGESNDLTLNFNDFCNNGSMNTLMEVTELPNASDYCSIDLLSSSESSTNDHCDVLKNEKVKTSNELTCCTCHSVFSDKQEYRLHIKEHGEDRYQCIQCCKFFPSSFRLKRHEEIHNEIASHHCPHCSRNYRASYNLKRHIKSVHLCKKSFECKVCNFSFSRVDVLKRHLQLHSDEKKFKCSECSRSFKTKDYLHAHHKARHTFGSDLSKSKKRIKKDNVSKNQCDYCGKMFKSLFAYKNHLLIHTNEKPYKCDACNKSFRTIAALTIHQHIHDDYRPYQCDLCRKTFRQTSHLKNHKMLHLENMPKHVCSICQTAFAKKSNLKAHMRIHTNEKPFKCTDCSSEFSFMHLLQQHASKVHCRSVHKVYTLNDYDIYGVDNGIINNDIMETETYQYISTIVDEDDHCS